MKFNQLLTAGAVMLATTGVASADDYDKRWHLSAMGSFIYSDEDRDNDTSGYSNGNVGEGLGFQLNIGRAISRSLDLDLQLHRSEPRNSAGNDAVDAYGAGLELSYYLAGRNKAFSPLLIAGVGYQQNQNASDDRDGVTADLGLGFVSQITDGGIAIKGDIRARYEAMEETVAPDNEFTDIIANLGIQLPFGSYTGGYADDAVRGDDNRWYIAPMLSYIFADDEPTHGGVNGPLRGAADNGYGGQLGLGKRLSDKWNAEFKLYANEISLESGSTDNEINKYGFGVDLQRFFSRRASFAPYAALGINAEKNQVWTGAGYDNRSYPTYDAALGFTSDITKHGTAVRGEVRYRLDAYDHAATGISEFQDVLVSLGLNIPLGSKAAPVVAAAAPVVVAAAPADSDNDGVLDEADQCPGTPAGTVVDVTGCPLQPVQVEVTEIALPEATIYFDLDSSVLKGSETYKLDAIIDAMLARGYLVGVSTGHASSEASDAYNLRLSRDRAAAVKSYLISKGVRGANVIAKGAGEHEPAASNATESGRSLNRRVEVRLLDE